jgi:hypothetical protein
LVKVGENAFLQHSEEHRGNLADYRWRKHRVVQRIQRAAGCASPESQSTRAIHTFYANTPPSIDVGIVFAWHKVVLQLDWLPTGEHAAYFAGLQRGFFRDAGIDLSITRGYGAGDTVNKVAAGAAKFGVADLGSVLAGRSQQSVPVKASAAVYTYSLHR